MALLLPGIRPRMVTSPRVSTPSASALDVPIRPRAHVAGLERAAAHGARGPTGFHDDAGAFDEGPRLVPREREARARALPGGWLGRLGRPARGLFLGRLVLGRRFLDRLIGDDQDPIRRLVVADAHRADVPQRIDRLEQTHVPCPRAGHSTQKAEPTGPAPRYHPAP